MTLDLDAALRQPVYIVPDLATMDALVDGTVALTDLEPVPPVEDQPVDFITIDGWTTPLYRQCPSCGSTAFPLVGKHCEACEEEDALTCDDCDGPATEADRWSQEYQIPGTTGRGERDSYDGVTCQACRAKAQRGPR